MTDTMEVAGVVYGAPIDGIFDGDAFPEGLNKGDKVLVRWSHHDSGYFGGPYYVGSVWATLSGAQFRAPIDHPIYGHGYGPEIKVDGMPIWLADDEQVIAKGFEPWAGGEEAPGDWDGGEVLLGEGCGVIDADEIEDWGRGDSIIPIIGYRKRAFAEKAEELIETLAAPEPTFKAGDYVVALESNTNIVEGNLYKLDEISYLSVCFRDDAGNDRARPKDNYRLATPAEIAQRESEDRLTSQYQEGDVCIDPAGVKWIAGTQPKLVTLPMMTEEEWDALIESHNHSIFPALRQLGILKSPPTLLEQFEAHHGGLDDNQRAIIEIYQEWIAAQ